MFKWLRDKFIQPVEKEIVYLTRDETAEEARAKARREFEDNHNAKRRRAGMIEIFTWENS